MDSKFEVELLEEAFKFIKKQDLKVRKKIFQNINRSRFVNDPKLLKKLTKIFGSLEQHTLEFNFAY